MAEIVTPWFGNADPGALSRVQQEKLRQFKINTRISNERYLRSHPEVELLVSDFVREVLLKRPENILEFAAEHFVDPEFPRRIQRKLEEREERE
ncbi:RIIa domain-containing protein 1 isoform X1 [Protopterus annectens]|uniref:RIIa domain-containing protein 1 isoform X1 n=1 Tax=Protopterus annectens TaxID=7888 RepID=UPI001CFB7E59|nr:RIIa domain-containing protein 1 isoform X1 [Protopterus annectens]